jgi:hypothetical protein
MKTAALAVLICSIGSTFLLGCADTRSGRSANVDRDRSDAYYSGKPDTVREAEQVDGRAGARPLPRPPARPPAPFLCTDYWNG